ncbi:MAG: hypothetical protein ABIP94_07420 [Planctomycetota bacterium]
MRSCCNRSRRPSPKSCGSGSRARPARLGALARVDAKLLVDDEVESAAQVLGKVRGRAMVPTGAPNDVALALAQLAVASYLEGKTVMKEIVVPGKLVNFVVR